MNSVPINNLFGKSNLIIGSTESTLVTLNVLLATTLLLLSMLLAITIVSSVIVISPVYLFHVFPSSILYSFVYPSGYAISIVLLVVQLVSLVEIIGLAKVPFSISGLKLISLISNVLFPDARVTLYESSGISNVVTTLTNDTLVNGVLFLSYIVILLFTSGVFVT